VHEVELVGLRTLHSNREDLEPSETTDMVDNLSHVSPFEATEECFIVNLKALETGHFVVILLLFLV
jgi:hypothetical protein